MKAGSSEQSYGRETERGRGGERQRFFSSKKEERDGDLRLRSARGHAKPHTGRRANELTGRCSGFPPNLSKATWVYLFLLPEKKKKYTANNKTLRALNYRHCWFIGD